MWRRWECFCFRTFGADFMSSSFSPAISSLGKANLQHPAQYDPPSLHSGRLSAKHCFILRLLIRVLFLVDVAPDTGYNDFLLPGELAEQSVHWREADFVLIVKNSRATHILYTLLDNIARNLPEPGKVHQILAVRQTRVPHPLPLDCAPSDLLLGINDRFIEEFPPTCVPIGQHT
jgi:hypothetical protein